MRGAVRVALDSAVEPRKGKKELGEAVGVYKTAFVIPDLIRDHVPHGVSMSPPDPGAGGRDDNDVEGGEGTPQPSMFSLTSHCLPAA